MSGRQSVGVAKSIAHFKRVKNPNVYRIAAQNGCNASTLYKALRALGYSFKNTA